MLNTLLKILLHLSLLALITCSFILNNAQANTNQVAIVIDDMGYRYTDKHALALPGAITYAFLPHTTYGRKLAVIANSENHDVLIHIPMESIEQCNIAGATLKSSKRFRFIDKSIGFECIEGK